MAKARFPRRSFTTEPDASTTDGRMPTDGAVESRTAAASKLEAAQRRLDESATSGPRAGGPAEDGGGGSGGAEAGAPPTIGSVDGGSDAASAAVAALAGREALPTDPASIAAAARDDIAAARSGRAAELVGDLDFDVERPGPAFGTEAAADDAVTGMAEMGGAAVASEPAPPAFGLDIEEFSTQIEQSLTPEAMYEEATRVRANASLSDDFAKTEVAEYLFELELRAEEAAKIEAEVKFQQELQGDSTGAAGAAGTPVDEHVTDPRVAATVAGLRERLAPRGGGGDGHTDPADDAAAVVRTGELPDQKGSLLGGDTRGEIDFGGGSRGLPDRDGGRIDPVDENDFGGGTGREIDPLADRSPRPGFQGIGDDAAGAQEPVVTFEPDLGEPEPIAVDLPFAGGDDSPDGGEDQDDPEPDEA